MEYLSIPEHISKDEVCTKGLGLPDFKNRMNQPRQRVQYTDYI